MTPKEAVSMSVGRDRTRPRRHTAVNHFLGPIRPGAKSWQKHCVSGGKQVCSDAWRPVATRPQSLRLDFPLAIYCWPSENWE